MPLAVESRQDIKKSLTETFHSIKSLFIFFAPILIPRVINSYRSLRASLAHRPPVRPLPPQASRALNVLFGAIVFFLILSLPFNPHAPTPNIFAQTGSRINTPTEVIFARLVRLRPDNVLTEDDILLRGKLTSQVLRKVYLRYGPDALLSCQFCTVDNTWSYLLYYLPLNTFVPHLFHLLIVGLVTSAPFAGSEAAQWRNKFTLAGLALAVIDIYIMAVYDPVVSASAAVRAGQAPPPSLYYNMGLLRPLAFAIFDGVCSFLIYLTATNRFFYSPPSQAEQLGQLMSTATTALTAATSKLHAVSVTRNAVVRDKTLKARDDAYWREVVVMEGAGRGEKRQPSGTGSIWEEEEVVRAMSRAMNGQAGNRGVDMAKLGTSASEYVDGITAGLENASDDRPE